MTDIKSATFVSKYSKYLYAFLNYKRLCGYKYNGESRELQRLDKCIKNTNIKKHKIFDVDIYKYLSKASNISYKTFANKNGIYKELYKYVLGNYKIYLPKPPVNKFKFPKSNYVPYIFTNEEISRIFNTLDKNSENYRFISKGANLLIKLLYTTGIRINEALSLKLNDIDINNGTIRILYGKNNNSRIVPVSDSLLVYLKKYIHKIVNNNDYLFSDNGTKHFAIETVYEWYRKVLILSNIHHGGRGKGPRLHDLRHTFAVHSLRKAIKSGTDINNFLPLLCTYLGHKRLSATEKYLRLVSEDYNIVTQSTNEFDKTIIPEVTDYEK